MTKSFKLAILRARHTAGGIPGRLPDRSTDSGATFTTLNPTTIFPNKATGSPPGVRIVVGVP